MQGGLLRVKEEVVEVLDEDTPSVWPGEALLQQPPAHVKQELPDVCIKVGGEKRVKKRS